MSRPKTRNAYETLNCRVPPGMVARISAHAERYDMKVRDVVAQFIETGLTGTPVAPLDVAAEDVVRQARKHFVEGLKMLDTTIQDQRRTITARLMAAQPDGIPPYDAEKFSLGKLCPRGHDFRNTGMTLRRKPSGRCDRCENERRREKRAQAA